MEFIIIIVTVILFLTLIGWTWSNLQDIDKSRKVIYLIISIVLTYIVTLIVFNISKGGVNYENQNMANDVQNVLVAVFTALNGFIIVQYIGKIIGKINSQEIDNEIAKRKIIIITIVFIAIIIFECSYMNSIQEGIIHMYNINK